MVNWDWLISAGILIVLALSIWAKVSKQTIPELIGNIVDRVRGTSEGTIDYATEIYD